jgi:hypothetical protein
MNLFGLDIDATQLWLLAAAGACTAWLIRDQVAAHRDRVNRRAAACAAFRSAIAKELGSIYPIPNAWPKDIAGFFKPRFDSLQTAVQLFRPFVRDKAAFDVAWLRYYCAYPDKWQEQCYHHYMSAYDPKIGTQEGADRKAKTEFHNNVSRLLAFANET